MLAGGQPGNYDVSPKPYSRMYDSNNPDCPPMPPDDPASHKFMKCVDGKKGSPFWDCHGKTDFVENPCWLQTLSLNPEGALVLDRAAAVQTALTNSSEYQTSVENLYLSALEVSYERFRFDTQFFGGNDLYFDAEGSALGGGHSKSYLTNDTNAAMGKLFATGGTMVVNMANSLVWQFSGPDDYAGMTLLDFNLVQPLLRGGGRAVVLEHLTDSERALLANIRQMERFQRGFYAQIIAGGSPGTGPSSDGLSIGSFSAGTSGSSGGILSLLRQQVQIRNQVQNVVALRESLNQLEALFNSGEITRLQVEQARLKHYQAQINLLDLRKRYQDRLDSYKITLGLPPSLPVRISDPLLSQFDLIDPTLTETQNQVTTLLADIRDPKSPEQLAGATRQLVPLGQLCLEQRELVRQDIRRLETALPRRRASLRELAKRPEFESPEIDPSIMSVESLDSRFQKIQSSFALISEELQETQSQLESLESLQRNGKPLEENQRRDLSKVAQSLQAQMVELSIIQARARLDTLMLRPLSLDPRLAIDIARENRRDWMNARAALVDKWRKIEVVANALESDLDVVFSGDLGTDKERPFRFRSTRGRLRVGLEFDAPLTRLAERNDYRRTLIDYQRTRRAYYIFEDKVDKTLRETLREIRLAQINFEQLRAAVYSATTQVDFTQIGLLLKPQQAGGSAMGATTARDVLDSINDLLNAQNNLLDLWVEYESLRISLAFNLGVLNLNSNGMWADSETFEEKLAESKTVHQTRESNQTNDGHPESVPTPAPVNLPLEPVDTALQEVPQTESAPMPVRSDLAKEWLSLHESGPTLQN